MELLAVFEEPGPAHRRVQETFPEKDAAGTVDFVQELPLQIHTLNEYALPQVLKETIATLKNSMGTTKVVAKNESLEVGGATIANLSQQDRQKYGVDGGVKVVRINGGKWKQANVREGFVITGIDNKKVNNVDELVSILSGKRGQGTLIEGVYPNGEKAYYGMPW